MRFHRFELTTAIQLSAFLISESVLSAVSIPLTNVIGFDGAGNSYPLELNNSVPHLTKYVEFQADNLYGKVIKFDGLPAGVNNAVSLSVSDGGGLVSIFSTTASNSSGHTDLQLPTDMVYVLSSAQQSFYSTLTTEQKAVADSLTPFQKAVIVDSTLLTSPTADQIAILNTLTTDQQLILGYTQPPVIIPVFAQTVEEIAVDKLAIEQIVFKLKNGDFITDNDSVLYMLGNSKMVSAVMAIIDNGGGFNALRNIGLTSTQALRVLSVYNVVLDTNKYLSETKLEELKNDPSMIVSLIAWLDMQNPPLVLPSLTPYLAAIRADHAVYVAIKDWNG